MVLVQVHRRLVACDLVAGHLVALLPEARRLTSQGILRQTSQLLHGHPQLRLLPWWSLCLLRPVIPLRHLLRPQRLPLPRRVRHHEQCRSCFGEMKLNEN